MLRKKERKSSAFLELRARFDEQNNINYATMLEEAGCTVIYGLSDYKIHAKLCLITRKVHNQIRYITQVGTGNYNEKTSELYTDLSFISTDQAMGEDATHVFQALCMGEVVDSTKSLWVAPNCFEPNVIKYIDEQIEACRSGKEGYVFIKVNSLNDMEIMEKLIEASQAGVKIEMVIRGICCLCPGVEGYSDNIRIKSIVGRYLEHSRIFIFGADEDTQRIFMGSGDLLNRNTRRRVEVFTEVKSADAAPRYQASGRCNPHGQPEFLADACRRKLSEGHQRPRRATGLTSICTSILKSRWSFRQRNTPCEKDCSSTSTINKIHFTLLQTEFYSFGLFFYLFSHILNFCFL